MTTAVPFWDRVDRSGGVDACWPWTGARSLRGYGRYSIWVPSTRSRVQYYAHRYAYADARGAFDPSLLVCHHCDNPPCCNPSHLFLGTNADNSSDRDRKGRQARLAGERHSQAKLTWALVREIRSSAEPGLHIARRLGVTRSMITRIRKGRAWKEPASHAAAAAALATEDET